MNKQQLASKIWESANKMRSKIEANEYKDYILGFIFYKFLCENQTKKLKELGFSEEDLKSFSETHVHADFAKEKVGYLIPHKYLFATWLEMGYDFSIKIVNEALSSFEQNIYKEHEKLYVNIFRTLQTGLIKLGESDANRTKAVSDLLELIKDIPMDGKQDYDVIGFIYEYLISMFAANAGKKAGEFYTPHEVSVLMSEIVAEHCKSKKEITIYDPTSGSGSLLINIGQSIAKNLNKDNAIKYYAQELKENTYNLTRMNLVMRGISPNCIVTRNGDTLEEDWPFFDDKDKINTYNTLYVDAVVSNPPYSQSWTRTHKENDPRYSRFGLAPKTKADYAFLLHDLYHIKPDGIMAIVLPHGVLFRGGEEGEIRKNLIEYNNIDAIIGLPANIFFGTGIPTIIMILKQHRTNNDILIIDASKGFIKEGKNNKLRASDIKKIVDTVAERKTIQKYSRVVDILELRENDYNLNIPRYVDTSAESENWDIYASMFGGIPLYEANLLQTYWDVFPNLKESLFCNINNEYVQLIHNNLKESISKHSDIAMFTKKIDSNFADFTQYLKEQLIDNLLTLERAKQETILSDNIFKRLENIPLIDKYVAYQLLDDNWTNIVIDLEIIQTEGFAVTKQVDPNWVMKKKKGKDVEVQDGWKGHVLPFNLVQQNFLQNDVVLLQESEQMLLDINTQLEEIIDSLQEEDKENLLNDTNDAFTKTKVTAKIKDLKGETAEEDIALLKLLENVTSLLIKQTDTKKIIKQKAQELHLKTKTVIENLTDEEVKNLLEIKWILPLVTDIKELPALLIQDLSKKIEHIEQKYHTTFLDLEKDIANTEKELCTMIDDLTGSDFDMQGLGEFKKLLGGEI